MAEEGKLNRWRLFAELTSEDADVVLKACEERNLVGGEELFRENDPGDSLFIVQSGRVDIFKNIRGDVDRSLASFGPGDVIGEMSFIDGARRSATARTTEKSEFLVLSRQSFAKVQRAQPADQSCLWEILYEALWDPPAKPRRPRSVMEHPMIAAYVKDWGSQSTDLVSS